MFLPYRSSAYLTRWPIANLVLVGLTVIAFAALVLGLFPESWILAMVLEGWYPVGLLGHMLLHGGLGHLFFNMLFLWTFGNAVCSRAGDVLHVGAYLVCGLAAAALHNLADGAPAIGASGAINGIVGFYVVLFPVDKVSCFWFLGIRGGVFEISGFWLVLLWFLGDAAFAFLGVQDGVAYWAHLGGLLAGVGLGIVALKAGWIALDDELDNPDLLEYLRGGRHLSRPVPKAHPTAEPGFHMRHDDSPAPTSVPGAPNVVLPPHRPSPRPKPIPFRPRPPAEDDSDT